MMWLGIGLTAWATAFAVHQVCLAVKADAAARASIATATERAALHNATKAQHEARKMEIQVELSRNARAAAEKLERELTKIRDNLLPQSATPPPRAFGKRTLHIVQDEKPPTDPAA